MDILVSLIIFFALQIAILLLLLCFVKYAALLYKVREENTELQLKGAVNRIFGSSIISRSEAIAITALAFLATVGFQLYVLFSN